MWAPRFHGDRDLQSSATRAWVASALFDAQNARGGAGTDCNGQPKVVGTVVEREWGPRCLTPTDEDWIGLDRLQSLMQEGTVFRGRALWQCLMQSIDMKHEPTQPMRPVARALARTFNATHACHASHDPMIPPPGTRGMIPATLGGWLGTHNKARVGSREAKRCQPAAHSTHSRHHAQ